MRGSLTVVQRGVAAVGGVVAEVPRAVGLRQLLQVLEVAVAGGVEHGAPHLVVAGLLLLLLLLLCWVGVLRRHVCAQILDAMRWDGVGWDDGWDAVAQGSMAPPSSAPVLWVSSSQGFGEEGEWMDNTHGRRSHLPHAFTPSDGNE